MSAGRRSLLIAMMLATGLMTTNLREARADISRGCAGQMWIFDRARDSSDVQKELLASIEGRGSCNCTEKRKCRKRAADAIIRCAREMWETRNTGVMPVSCVQRRGQSNFARATLEGIFPFLPLGHVLDRGRRAVCCKFNRVRKPGPGAALGSGDRRDWLYQQDKGRAISGTRRKLALRGRERLV